MAKAYTPGLKVAARTVHRSRRALPISGEVLVKVGQRVRGSEVVARTFMPGDITPVNVANLLSCQASDVPAFMLKKIGDTVADGEVIARSRGMFGMFKTEAKARSGGTIENISGVTGQVMLRGTPIPVQVLAYLDGVVVEVLPGEGCIVQSECVLVQGIFGIGGEAFGKVRLACKSPDETLHEDLIRPDMKGEIIIGGARMTVEAIRTARSVGAAAIIAGGIDDQDLKDFLGYDQGVAITGSEQLGLTVIITEGFGDIAMAHRTFDLLRRHEGYEASVNGATQIRAGVMRPEIIIALPTGGGPMDSGRTEAGYLEIGTPVRIIRDPHFGLIGTVSDLPPEPHVLGSGSKARVLEVKLDSGESVVIPRANVELIEE